MTDKRQQLEALATGGQWLNDRVPTVVTATEAHAQKGDHRFYTVAWWGELPAGFTRFDFQNESPEGYAIIW